MSDRYEKLKKLLKELFQLDQPDLDFGLYRIMHAKSAEVTAFLDNDLLPQVKQAFALYKPADKAAIEQELAQAIEQARSLGVDPESTQKVKDLREKLATTAVDIASLEAEVYDHLYSFFRRYYSEGDFLSKRVYKEGVYAIPYEGEEVTLHWANKDQYYIKTSEYLRDYCIRLRPDDAANPMRVHFRLADAVEGEHGNVKAAEGKDRVFVLAAAGDTGHDFLSLEDGPHGPELSIRFEYRPATLTDWPAEVREGKTKAPAQKDLTAFAVARVLAVSTDPFGPWITELRKPHVTTSGDAAGYSRLEGHLKRYTARNTFDYFIHKDLGTFLRRELDFYIKNEVMHLDDIENEKAPRVEQYLSKIRVVRRISGKIIDFLAQLEDFQKKLWLKKRFVVETQWCVTVDRVPADLLSDVCSNDEQINEWVRLFRIDQIEGDLTTPAFTRPLSEQFLRNNPTLPIDTRWFSTAFTSRLLESAPPSALGQTNVLIHGENSAALRFANNALNKSVHCVYIDPPFNTGDDGFIYKDNYQHSSWCALMQERLSLIRNLVNVDGLVAISIDQAEIATLQELCDEVFGRSNRISTITVKRGSVTGHKVVNPGVVNVSEYVLTYAHDRATWSGHDVYAERERDERYNIFIVNRAGDPEEWSFESLLDAFARKVGVPKAQLRDHLGVAFEETITEFVVQNANAVAQFVTVNRAGVGADFLEAVRQSEAATDKILIHKRDSLPDAYLLGGKKIIFYADKLINVGGRQVTAERASDIWLDVLPNDLHNEGGVELRKGKKPEALVARLIEMGSTEDELVVDFFAGSGTALAAAHKAHRRWLGVEAASYFDDKPLTRLKNVLRGESRGVSQRYGWKGGGAFKYIRLESYEDTLNNLDIRRSDTQKSLLDELAAKGDGKLREQYLLKYMLDVETRGSQSLLNVAAFRDPTAYRLSVKRPGSDESREVCVDLVETFNWLIGLAVEGIAAPQVFSASFERDEEKRLQLKGGRIKADASGPFWFRRVEGKLPDGRKALVVWRKLGDDLEQANLVLDHFLTDKLKISTKDFEFDVIYVNGSNNLENLKAPDDTWKVRLLEEEFHRLMFATEDV